MKGYVKYNENYNSLNPFILVFVTIFPLLQNKTQLPDFAYGLPLVARRLPPTHRFLKNKIIQ